MLGLQEEQLADTGRADTLDLGPVVGAEESATSRSRVCTFHYRGSKRHQQQQQKKEQQLQQARIESGVSIRMPTNREMPSYEEWKQRRANRPFGQEVILLELDPKEELARRKQRDQRLMSLMNTDQQDKFYTYLDHHERMQAKVVRDREDRERRKAEEAQQAAAEAEARKREQHKLRKRLDRVALETDSGFVADVAKSRYYRLIQREQKQNFRSQDERDDFWQGHLQSEGLLRPVSTPGAGGFGGQAGTSGETMGGIAELDEEPELQQPHLHWEKTEDHLQLGRSGGGGGATTGGGGGFHSMSRAQQNRMLEELFPRAERPKLVSLEADYGKKEEKTVEELELERLQARRRQRLDEWREHRHMQQMAVTFGVATRRILDERPVRDSADRLMDEANGDLSQMFGGALENARRRQEAEAQRRAGERELDLTDPRLLQSWRHRRRRKPGTRGGTPSGETDASSFISVGRRPRLGEERTMTTPATQNLDEDDDGYGEVEGRGRRQKKPQRALLSLEEANRELPQLEAKGQSTLWNNYMGAGNVRFAPLDDDEWYRSRETAAAATASG